MTEPVQFQPFTDRMSRDIRNALSTSLVQCLKTGSAMPAEETSAKFDIDTLPDSFRDYIENRLNLYRRAVELIADVPEDPIRKAMVLWNLGLFFEVHEVLEHAWYDAKDDYKLILQALIRAAGVYIKLEYGYRGPAERIAAKALTVLEEQQETLRQWFHPEPLLEALKTTSTPAPKLSL